MRFAFIDPAVASFEVNFWTRLAHTCLGNAMQGPRELQTTLLGSRVRKGFEQGKLDVESLLHVRPIPLFLFPPTHSKQE